MTAFLRALSRPPSFLPPHRLHSAGASGAGCTTGTSCWSREGIIQGLKLALEGPRGKMLPPLAQVQRLMDVLVFPQGWWLQASQLYLNTIESKGFHIQCKWLFVQALMHRSAFGFATDVSTMRCCSYERLEYVGDALLSLVVAQHDLTAHPLADEGQLSIIRSQTVNNKSLHRAAVRLGLHSCILSSPPLADMVGGGHTVIADVAESLSGAILIDQGLVVASTWVQSVLLPHVLLGRAEAGGGFRQLAVSPPASLHVNRRLGLEIALRSCDNELLAKGIGRAGATKHVLQRNKR